MRPSLAATTASMSAERTAAAARRGGKGARILGKTRAAEARTGLQVVLADAAVLPHAAGDHGDIGADLLAQVGELVDEGDAHGEIAVGGIFDELGGFDTGEGDRHVADGDRPVEPAQHLAGALGLGADDDPVGSAGNRSTADPSRRNSGLEAMSKARTGTAAGDLVHELARGADREPSIW